MLEMLRSESIFMFVRVFVNCEEIFKNIVESWLDKKSPQGPNFIFHSVFWPRIFLSKIFEKKTFP